MRLPPRRAALDGREREERRRSGRERRGLRQGREQVLMGVLCRSLAAARARRRFAAARALVEELLRERPGQAGHDVAREQHDVETEQRSGGLGRVPADLGRDVAEGVGEREADPVREDAVALAGDRRDGSDAGGQASSPIRVTTPWTRIRSPLVAAAERARFMRRARRRSDRRTPCPRAGAESAVHDPCSPASRSARTPRWPKASGSRAATRPAAPPCRAAW